MATAPDPDGRAGPDFLARLVGFHASAYRLALHVLGNTESAEDAIQQSYLEVISRIRTAPPPHDERAWFLRAVANTAKDHLKREARRRKREAAVVVEQTRSMSGPGLESELTGALRATLASLEAKYRLPLALCYQEDMTQHQAAAVLGIPEGTIGKYVRVGLTRLRKALERAGYAAAFPAAASGVASAEAGPALIQLLKQTAPPVPASLAGRVEELVATGATGSCGGGLSGAMAAAKGGRAMKVLAGVAFAGAVAAGVAALAPRGGGDAPLPEVAVSGPHSGARPAGTPGKKFAIPVWHPDARWVREKEPFGGSGLTGQTDGPLRQAMWCRTPSLSVLTAMPESGPYGFRSYDPETKRIHMTVGGACGYLDGPLARARFGRWGYSGGGIGVVQGGSPSKRFHFFLDRSNGHLIRRIDLREQEVTTFVRGNWKDQILWPDDDGGLRCFRINVNEIRTFNPQGKLLETLKLAAAPKHTKPKSLLLDEVRGRLYAGCQYGTKTWYVWYWDLKDGSFHGVIPMRKRGGVGSGRPGPLEGAVFYPEIRVRWGPDDPERNCLYLLPNDTGTHFMLDLKKRHVRVATMEKDVVRVVGSGKWNKLGVDLSGWMPDGSFYGCQRWGHIYRFRRTR
jgi:RNA polymerase sigma-70 factor (ECF subfamily)